eukprot:2479885-Amphidinium_carterae.1
MLPAPQCWRSVRDVDSLRTRQSVVLANFVPKRSNTCLATRENMLRLMKLRGCRVCQHLKFKLTAGRVGSGPSSTFVAAVIS